jgi:RNA-directed DNA polymerase
MGLLSWITGLLRRKAPTRDVSRLRVDDDAVTVAVETVDTRPVPLKPAHLRLTHRDPRLLPKPPWTPPKFGQPGKRPRLMSADEADRLFSPSMRTRNRNLRDLVTDEAQLERYGLPLWRTEAELAQALGLTVRTLRHYTIHSYHDRVSHYVSFAVPKRSGGERLLMAPKRRLKALQRRMNELLIARLPVSEFAHGFLPKRSVRTNAEPHVGKPVVMRLDLKDFFPSIHHARVRGLLIALGYGYPVANTIALLCTESPRQPVKVGEQILLPPVGARACPQGAPTSPGLSNALLVKMDRRIAGLARKQGFAYTRYADDMTFSGDDCDRAHALRLQVTRVIGEEGFELNTAKTRVMRAGGRQVVAGVTVNEVLGLSREERRLLRAQAHRLNSAPAADPGYARLRGMLSYLRMLNPAQAAAIASRRGRG